MCCGVVRGGSRDAPILVGNENGTLYRCRSLVGQFIPYSAVGWFTGDGVPVRIAVGTLELVA